MDTDNESEKIDTLRLVLALWRISLPQRNLFSVLDLSLDNDLALDGYLDVLFNNLFRELLQIVVVEFEEVGPANGANISACQSCERQLARSHSEQRKSPEQKGGPRRVRMKFAAAGGPEERGRAF